MATTMKRWTCPICGDTRMAPGRPRRDDARAFCLTCSADTGKLVRRTCPALEKKRTAKQEAASAAAVKAREARKAAKVGRKVAVEARAKAAATMHGADLRAAAPLVWRVLMRVTKAPAQTTIPTVSLHRRGHGGGLSYGSRDRVTVSMRTDLANAAETLVHELCHKAVGNRHNHDAVFVNTLFRACVALWGSLGVNDFRERGYDFDRKYVVALRQLMLSKGTEAVLGPLGLTTPAEGGMPVASSPTEGETSSASPTEA